MRAAAQHPLSAAIVAIAFLTVGAVFLFARPQFHPKGEGSEVRIPANEPAVDASGAAGWAWPDGLPGWRVGETFDGYDAAGLREVELRAAESAAARRNLDASDIRVLASTRASASGVLAILVAQRSDSTPAETCLGTMLSGPAPVRWFCPGTGPRRNDLANVYVLVAAAADPLTSSAGRTVVTAVGVARGDVARVVLTGTGEEPQRIYTRGSTWGQFEIAHTVAPDARLEVYNGSELVDTVRLDLAPGEQRILR